MGNSQPKVIETIVTCILLYSYWTTLTCVVVLLIDDGSGGSSIQKLKREGVLQIDNEKEMKTAVLPHSWCWQQRNFSSTQPFHQGDGFRWSDQWSAVIRLWYASPIHPYTEPSPTLLQGLPCTLTFFSCHIFTPVILSFHPAGWWQRLPTVPTSGCYFSCLLLPGNPFSLFPV